MKKIMALILATVSFSSFALDCSMMQKNWRGNLGSKITNVNLSIHKPDQMEDASISFNDDGANTSFGLLKGRCEKQSDGSPSITLTRSAWGVNANLVARMTSENALEVTSFSYSMMSIHSSGSGTLN